MQKVVIDHLGSKVVNLATAQNIYDAITTILQERGLGWERVVSVLMDNCNTMRGKKNGVQTLIRETNTSLLDISGETIHIVHTSASHMCQAFDKFLPLQELAGDIYYDAQDSSPKSSYLFGQVQEHLYSKEAKRLIRPISNRFLQMKDVADRLHDLLDALVVFYFAHLTPEEQKEKSSLLDELFEKHATTVESQAKIKTIIATLGKGRKSQSKESMSRKDKILLYLFNKMDRLKIAIATYRGILSQFSGYVKLFQSESPLTFRLHAEMYTVISKFFSLFIDPQHIPEHDANALVKLNVEDQSLHLRDRKLAVGEFCHPLLREMQKDQQKHASLLKHFYDSLRCGYIAGAKSLKKLPVTNKTIINLAALNPGIQRSASTAGSLYSLATALPNVVPPDQLGKLDIELKGYTSDPQIANMEVDETDPSFCIDSDWWVKIFRLTNRVGQTQEQRYPVLTSLVKALLGVFSGPIVEGSFNIMGDIIEEDRSRLTTDNYEALAIVKQHLKATGTTAVTVRVTEGMKLSVHTSYQRYQLFLQNKENNFKKHLKSSRKEPAVPRKHRSESPTPSGHEQSARVETGSAQKGTGSESTSCSREKLARPACPSAHSQPQSFTGHERKLFFSNLLQRLEVAGRNCFEELEKVSADAVEDIRKWPLPICKLQSSADLIDLQALGLYPTDGPDLEPVKVFGDGNCLVRCASLLSFGSEENHVEMRARVVVELATNKHFYLAHESLKGPSASTRSQNLPALYAQYSECFALQELTQSVIEDIYKEEVTKAAVNNSYLSMWAVHGVTSVLGVQLHCIYPQYGGATVREDLNRIISPRVENSSAASYSILGIMWSRLRGKDLPEQAWRPNHFVACLPPSRCSVSRKHKLDSHGGPPPKKKAADIRSFFSCR